MGYVVSQLTPNHVKRLLYWGLSWYKKLTKLEGFTIMKYTIEKLIHLLNIGLKNESLIDDEAFDMLNKLCNKLNNIEE